MSKLRVTLGCWNYDRIRALQDGRVRPDGIDLVLDMPVEPEAPFAPETLERFRI
jgi:4,5-dihydroxyphthalate decarboxylase